MKNETKQIQFTEVRQPSGTGILSKYYTVELHVNGCPHGRLAIKDFQEYDGLIPAGYFGALLFDLTSLGYTILPTLTA